MPRIIDVNASIPARFITVDVVARLVGPSAGRHSPVPSLGSDSEDEPANVAYLRATAGRRCAAAFVRLTSLHWRDHIWSTSYSGTHDSGTHDMHVPHAQVVERIDRLPGTSDFRCCHCRDHRPIHAAGVSTVACCGGFGGRDGDGDGDGDICEMDQEHSVRGIRNSGGNDDDADDDDDAPLLTFRQRQDAQVLIWYMGIDLINNHPSTPRPPTEILNIILNIIPNY